MIDLRARIVACTGKGGADVVSFKCIIVRIFYTSLPNGRIVNIVETDLVKILERDTFRISQSPKMVERGTPTVENEKKKKKTILVPASRIGVSRLIHLFVIIQPQTKILHTYKQQSVLAPANEKKLINPSILDSFDIEGIRSKSSPRISQVPLPPDPFILGSILVVERPALVHVPIAI